MNHDQACNLIQQTFKHTFDKSRFLNFTRNVLNRIDESKASVWNSQSLKDAFKAHVQRYERLGTYTSPGREKLDVLIVHLTDESKLERARTAIRNFVADHLKTRDERDAALVAFVSPSETTWRFSYVKMEYATVEKDSGKVGVETRLTPARRFSYIVGEGESCHTAQTRFLNLLQDTETDPALADIEEAFSVEAVTKEFFIKYRELFEEIQKALEKLVANDKTIRDEFTAKGVNTVDFAKKLMGQIVFLYFLQKKGWLGVAKGHDWGSGPSDFLRRLANGEYGKYDNFFNNVLEPLFYDTLATDRGHEAWCNRFKCRIPFLDGGLFEPLGDYDWRKTDIILPNKLFTNPQYVDEGITGTGVLDVFDRYNFTVNEAEPLEKEVAIDPEMLGKVFENLIEENRRKGLGAYYTPREIVHYMCQESLINYLATAINTHKESLGPGKPKQAKLLGEPKPEQTTLKTTAYEEVVIRADIETFVHLGEQISHYEAVETKYRIQMPKSIEQHAQLIDEKLAEITICDPAVGSGAFPVGMMTEIVRARGALTPYLNDGHERTSYYFKHHAIQNCLYGVDIDAGAVEIAKLRLWLSLVVDEEDVKQIKPLPNLDYKIIAGNSLLGFPFKSQRLGEIEKLKERFFDETDHDKKAELKAKVEKLLAEVFTASKKSLGYEVNFDFQIFFSEVFQRKSGFDLVIANPPYLAEKNNKEIFRPIAQGNLKKFYNGKMDLFYFFFHLALDLGRIGTQVAFISTNYYITATAAKTLRTDLKERATIRNLINFNELRIFESALGQHNMITIFSKGRDNEIRAQNCITHRKGLARETTLRAIISDKDEQTDYFELRQAELYFEEENFIRIGMKRIDAILDKVRAKSTPLLEICNVREGIQTGENRVFVFDGLPEFYKLLDNKEKKLIVKFHKNSDILRYCISDSSKYVLYFQSDIEIDKYPNIKRYLCENKRLLESRAQIKRSSQPWYVLLWPRNEAMFSKMPKIVTSYRPKINSFCYTDGEFYSGTDTYYIVEQNKSFDLKFVLGIINSKLSFAWLRTRGKVKGDVLELTGDNIEQIPIPESSQGEQKTLINLVDRILAAKKRDPQADTTSWEHEIDQLVYKLYGLTPEEIAVIEASTRAK